MQQTVAGKINRLDITRDTLTSRGGLAFFVQYVESIGVVGLLLRKFAGNKKSGKGVTVGICFYRSCTFSWTAPAGTYGISMNCSRMRATGRWWRWRRSKWRLPIP